MCRLSNPTRNIIHKANMQHDLYYFLRNQMVELFTKVKVKKKSLKQKKREKNESKIFTKEFKYQKDVRILVTFVLVKDQIINVWIDS